MFLFRPRQNQYYHQQYYRPHPMHFSHYPSRYPIPPTQTTQPDLSKNINIESILNKIQKILGIAEQVTPLIEQYGPLIKSAPALLQLLKDTSDEDDDDQDDDDDENEINIDESIEDKVNEPSIKKKRKKRKSEIIKESVPKLYI